MNHVCIWRFPATAKAADEEGLNEPELVCAQTSPADIMDLVFLNRDHLACALSDGSVAVFSYKEAVGVRDKLLRLSIKNLTAQTLPPIV